MFHTEHYKTIMKSIYCKCGNIRRNNQRNCNECHAAYMREYNKSYQYSEIQIKKKNCRTCLNVYIRRGKIKKNPCSICGSQENIEAHHQDYDKPLDVVWFCRSHHLECHRENIL